MATTDLEDAQRPSTADGHKEVQGSAYEDMGGAPDHFTQVSNTVVDTAVRGYENTVQSFKERPSHSGILAATAFGVFFTLVSLITSWYETSHTAETDNTEDDIHGHISLFEVHTCYDQQRSDSRPAHECRMFSLAAAPTSLKPFFDAGAAAGFFMLLLLILEIVLIYFTVSFHLGIANWAVQGFGCCCRCVLGLTDKTFLVGYNGLVSFLFMLTFSIYAGVVNRQKMWLGLRVATDNRHPSSHNYGGGFALVIINWMLHAGIAVALQFFVEGNPLNEPVPDAQAAGGKAPGMPPTGQPHVHSGAAAEFVGSADGGAASASAAEQGQSPDMGSGAGDYSAPLTEPTTGDGTTPAAPAPAPKELPPGQDEEGEAAATGAVDVSIGGDEDEGNGDDDEWNSEPTGGSEL